MEFGAQRNGSPQLHAMLAEYIYSESPELVGLPLRFRPLELLLLLPICELTVDCLLYYNSVPLRVFLTCHP